jgi:hypothetical protein
LAFRSSSCASLGLRFEIQILFFSVVNGLIKGEIEKPSGQYLGLHCDGSLTCLSLNLNRGHFGYFTFIFVSHEESYLFVSWCAGDRCDMTGSDKDYDRSRRPGAEDRGWSSTCQVLGGRTIQRRRGARVSWLSLKTKVDSLSVVWLQNHWFGFTGLGLKTGSYSLVIWTSKSLRRFLGFGPQNYVGYGLLVAPQNRREDTRRDLAACFAWMQVGLGFSSLASRLVEARHRWCM